MLPPEPATTKLSVSKATLFGSAPWGVSPAHLTPGVFLCELQLLPSWGSAWQGGVGVSGGSELWEACFLALQVGYPQCGFIPTSLSLTQTNVSPMNG